jgi:tetratricopeptide (TPR) repeat protein
MKTIQLLGALTLCHVLASTAAIAQTQPLQEIQLQWAQCQYNIADEDEKEACFDSAITSTNSYLQKSPENPELTVWLAINKASLAGVKGGIGALSLVKQAKTLLEGVIETSPQTLDGSAYTSLGSLYYKVPGWPVGFGSNKKAEQMLKKALEINPNGIDQNYFYGDFLAEDGRIQDAKLYFSRALQAPPRLDRPLADKGRKLEIETALGRLK